MRVQLLDNRTKDASVLSALLEAMEQSSDLRLGVAFASRQGVEMIADDVTARLETGASVEFLVGLDMLWTEPQALELLNGLARTHPKNAFLYCYVPSPRGSIFHPKLYLMRNQDSATAIVGSSNLTRGGLKANVEVNALIRASVADDFVTDAYNTYLRLKFDPRRVRPDDELLRLYGELWEARQQGERQWRGRSSVRTLVTSLTQKAKSLPRPTCRSVDLVGWARLVYEALPKGDFSTEQVYQFEDEFRQAYPQNLNIRAKIRQQLQVLRDIGLIAHVSRGRWRR